MARTDTLSNYLTDVASAIKTKKGDSTPIQASSFDTEIANLPSGGGFEILEGMKFGQSQWREVPSLILNANGWSSLVNPKEMFYNNTEITSLPNFNLSSATTLSSFCFSCSKLVSVGNITTGNSLTSLKEMFAYCHKLQMVGSISNTSNVTSTQSMFNNCDAMTSAPQLDTSSVTDIRSMFSYCKALSTVPLYDTSSVQYMNDMFSSANSLDDTSVNNVLKMCADSNVTNVSNKTLYKLGFRSTYYPVSRIEALSNYQAFLDAGWTIGY